MAIDGFKITNMVLRMLGSDTINEIDNYVKDVCSRDFMVMKSVEQVEGIFSSSVNVFLNCLNEDDLLNLRSYTGYNFRNINALLRGIWTYENNGQLSREKEEELRKLCSSISKIIKKFNIPNIDFVSFRGTTLDSFSNYGITELSQIKNLEGKFLYEQGFISTSILEDTSYFNKTLNDGKFYNIEIRYLISSECDGGALLIDNDTSYSANQNEFLLDSGSLSKIVDVNVDEKTNTVILTAVLIPRKIYDLNYNKINNASRKM